MRYFSQLRYPWLFALTAGLFVLDLLVPDMLPFADELLLGLTTMRLATRSKERPTRGAWGLVSGNRGSLHILARATECVTGH